MAKQWLIERWKQLLPKLASLGIDQEEEIARLCMEEIAAWRARPLMKSASSLRVPMTDSRNKLRETLSISPENSWVNPRTGAREHLALKYLNFSEEEWAAMNAPSDEVLEQRLIQTQVITQPEAIVDKAIALLTSERWEDIAVGLAVSTGRRLTEVLKTGEFSPKTAYTLVFGGQLKRKDAVLDPYEIPTLCRSQAVLDAWSRLRAFLDCTDLTPRQVSDKYSRFVSEAADHHFHDLVPPREGKDSLYTHLFRSVYGAIAVFFYCPDWVADVTYLSTIQGHYWVEQAEGEQKRNYISTLHYFDYRVGDAQGHVDKRVGIRLEDPDVKTLEVFQRKEPSQPPRSSSRKNERKGLLNVERKSKTGYSIAKPRQETKARLEQIRLEEEYRTDDETLTLLADEHYLLRQIAEMLAATRDEFGTQTPVETLRALLTAYRSEDAQKAAAKTYVNEHWQTTVEELETLMDEAKGQDAPVAYLKKLVEKQKKVKSALKKRHEGKDYATMPFSKLKGIHMPDAAEERYRRAVNAIIAHNLKVSDPLHRWYINQKSVHGLVGGRQGDIAIYLESRADEIAQHHQSFHPPLKLAFNRKPIEISQMVQIPEMPEKIDIGDAEETIADEQEEMEDSVLEDQEEEEEE